MTNSDIPRSFTVVDGGRDANGRFTSGAGNIGRVPGSRNRVSNEALKAVRDMKDDAIAILREKLIARDWNAVLFVLERTLPKGRMIELDAATPAAITDALITGQLTSEEAKHLATVLEKIASIAAVDELRERIAALEAHVGNSQK